VSGARTDDHRAARLALAALPQVGPHRLDALLAHGGSPVGAWQAVLDGRLAGVDLRRSGSRRDDLVTELVAAARTIDPDALLGRHLDAGIQMLVPDDAAWPFGQDPEPPIALFARGDLGLLDRRAVAVVGTRRCTAAGLAVARSLGAGLGAAGVPVVSGLALGIDGAAHRGALEVDGPAIGVVGSGLDVVYPRRNRWLWDQVATRGLLVSEAPLGVVPERWRFPARNRLIAALAAAVVVVESPAHGGSMSTVEAALERQVEVLAVPGPVLGPQSAGTNRLLAEGAGIARDAADVLAAIGGPPSGPIGTPSVEDAGPAGLDDPLLRIVAGALAPVPTGVEAIAEAARVELTVAMTALARLEVAGVARRVPGGYEQVVR